MSKKVLYSCNILLAIVNITMLIYTVNNVGYDYRPELKIYGYMHDYIDVQPLLVSFEDTDTGKVKKYASQRQMNKYLEDERNMVSAVSINTLKLDFLDRHVYEVGATVDGTSISIRNTDGQFYLDHRIQDEPMRVEITSTSESGIATYVFMLDANDGSYDQDKYKNPVQKEYEASLSRLESYLGIDRVEFVGSQNFYREGEESKYIGYGFVFMIKNQSGNYDVYGVDITLGDYSIYKRNAIGYYSQISG